MIVARIKLQNGVTIGLTDRWKWTNVPNDRYARKIDSVGDIRSKPTTYTREDYVDDVAEATKGEVVFVEQSGKKNPSTIY